MNVTKLIQVRIFTAHIENRHKMILRHLLRKIICKPDGVHYFINEIKIACKYIWLVCSTDSKGIAVCQPLNIDLNCITCLQYLVLTHQLAVQERAICRECFPAVDSCSDPFNGHF